MLNGLPHNILADKLLRPIPSLLRATRVKSNAHGTMYRLGLTHIVRLYQPKLPRETHPERSICIERPKRAWPLVTQLTKTFVNTRMICRFMSTQKGVLYLDQTGNQSDHPA